MADYKHGTYGLFDKSISTSARQAGTVAVYVGTAPVNLVRDYAAAGRVNAPVKLTSYEDAQRKIGMSDDWDKFSLCEAVNAHFKNELGNIGPIYIINVLDPASHKKESQTTTELTFANGRATIVSDTIVLDTLALASKVEGTDYAVEYDYRSKTVTITSIGDDVITGAVNVTYDEIDTSKVTAADVVGGVSESGVYTGIGCVGLIYQAFNAIPNILAAPGWSEQLTVYKALLGAASKINGHWDAVVMADIPMMDDSNAVDTIDKAIKWKTDNGVNAESAKVFWPMVAGTDGKNYHLSTLWVVESLRTDAEHSGVPMESASNKAIPAVKQYFGAASKNGGYDTVRANELNANGITTAVFWGGRWVLWGPHTAAYNHGNVDDKSVIFDNSLRMMMHISNSFQAEHGTVIDQPMTRGMADTIKNREQEKADALAAMGALLGEPVVDFLEEDNSSGDLIEGNFVWRNRHTPTPPFKSGTLRVAYTDQGFTSYFGGDE